MIAGTIAAALVVVGAAFMLVAGVGIVRMPDFYMRMSATAKAGTLGIGCILLGMVIHFGDVGVAVRALAVIFFGFLTVPVAAHMIARAAYFVGVPLWEGTVVDELSGRYDLRTHLLQSPPSDALPDSEPPVRDGEGFEEDSPRGPGQEG